MKYRNLIILILLFLSFISSGVSVSTKAPILISAGTKLDYQISDIYNNNTSAKSNSSIKMPFLLNNGLIIEHTFKNNDIITANFTKEYNSSTILANRTVLETILRENSINYIGEVGPPQLLVPSIMFGYYLPIIPNEFINYANYTKLYYHNLYKNSSSYNFSDLSFKKEYDVNNGILKSADFNVVAKSLFDQSNISEHIHFTITLITKLSSSSPTPGFMLPSLIIFLVVASILRKRIKFRKGN